MNRRQALARGRQSLAGTDPEATPIEAEVLLRHALGLSRVQFFQGINEEIAPGLEAKFWNLVERRCRGEPVAYITGHREFYGLDFYVDRRVLIPRPESELLVEKSLSLAQGQSVTAMADIGTGCGAIAICLALNLPVVKMYAADISTDALEVARLNSRRYNVADRIVFLKGDLLEPLPESVDIIVANLPYVAEAELRGQVSFEPSVSRDGGPDGLWHIRRLCRQLPGKLRSGGHLLLEIGCGQREAVVSLLSGAFPGAPINTMPDLAGIDRVVCFSLTAGTGTVTAVSNGRKEGR